MNERYRFYLLIGILIFGVWKWSIIPLTQEILSGVYTSAPQLVRSSNGAKPFPILLQRFTDEIVRNVSEEDNFLYVTEAGIGEMEYFSLVYLLSPRRVYWISNILTGPISWWDYVSFSPEGIISYMNGKHIRFALTYDTRILSEDSSFQAVLSEKPFILFSL